MKIHKSITVNELPGGSSITLAPDGSIRTVIEAEYCSVAEAVQLRDALTLVIEYAQSPEAHVGPARPPRTRRVWRAGHPQPDGVTSVWDSDGDGWRLRPGNCWTMDGVAGNFMWDELLEAFGPLHEKPDLS